LNREGPVDSGVEGDVEEFAAAAVSWEVKVAAFEAVETLHWAHGDHQAYHWRRLTQEVGLEQGSDLGAVGPAWRCVRGVVGFLRSEVHASEERY